MPNLSKQLLLYNGYDQVPVVDYTTDTDWQQTELGNNATNGDGAQSTWVVDVPEGDVPDHRGATGTKYISSHNRLKLFVGSNTIWRGRDSGKAVERGPTRGTRPQEWNVTESDPNSELQGMIVHNWARGSETDVARVQGLVASYLSGSPRPSTVLNGSNYVVTGSNTVTMAAKTYTAVTPAEVLQEIARFADKDMFVDVDDNLHYHGHDYTGFDSPLRISDDLADLNSTTLLPISPKLSEEGLDQITVLRSYYGADEVQRSVQVTDNSHLLTTDYWEDVFYDEDSVTTAQALVAARQALAPRRLDQISWTVRVGLPGVIQDGNGTPMRGDFCYMLKAGMRIAFKARAARGGIANNGSRPGDSFITVHIREVRWSFPGPDQYFADLTLERPIRPFRGRAQPKATTPKPAPACEPDTPGVAIHTWDFAADTNPSFDNETGLVGIQLTAEDNASICPFGAAICGWAHSSHNSTDQFAVTAGNTYTFAADMRWQYGVQGDDDDSAVYMRWYSSPSVEILPLIPLVSFVGRSTGVSYHVSNTVVAPVGATLARLTFRTSCHADNIVWGSAGVPADNPDDCFDYGDSPHESGDFLPADTVADRLAALTAADGIITEGGWLSWKLPVRVATTAAGTLASSFEAGDTIDGVVLADEDRILIKDQAAGAANGIYIVAASGAPTRAVDADDSSELGGMTTLVMEGTANGNKVFVLTTNEPITLGSTSLTFAESGAIAEGFDDDALEGDRAMHGRFIATYHRASDTKALVMYSDDGLTFRDGADIDVNGSRRDPSLIHWDGTYWVVLTHGTTSLRLYSSTDLETWTGPTTITVDAGATQSWAPEWIRNLDGTPFLHASTGFPCATVNVSTDSESTFTVREIHPTNRTMTSWSSPVTVTGTGLPTKMIDAFLLVDGDDYWLWFKEETNKRIEIVHSTTALTSGYTVFESADWAGWFAAKDAGANSIEGPCVVRLEDGRWRIYFNENNGFDSIRAVYSETTDDWRTGTSTWTTQAVITTDALMSHGTVNFIPSVYDHQRDPDAHADLLGSIVTDLDGLSDVTLTGPAEGDMLRFDGSVWVNTPGRWEPVTTNPGGGPELVWDGDEILMTWVNT